MRMRSCLTGLAAGAALLGAVPARAQPDIFYIVFFDNGSARLDEADRAIIDTVASILRDYGKNAILLGNADRAGDPVYNRTLACRRARAVRAYLASRGIPPSRIAVQSAGEERPVENTRDGIAEPQNRSVNFTIVDHRPTAAEGAGIPGCARP